jgi:hypothetical protein
VATPTIEPISGYPAEQRDSSEHGAGWLLFAGIMMSMLGVLNIIYGIAAISNSHFFVNSTHYVFGNLKTWGWVTLIVGVVQIFAAFSVFAGRTFGRVVGIAIASLSAIAALLAIPAYPFWSLAIFTLDLVVI